MEEQTRGWLGYAAKSRGIEHQVKAYARLKNHLLAHYPSYCAKYNPIERRLFPHVARVCQGLLFDTLAIVVGLMRTASTTTGLQTTVNVIRRVSHTGRKVADDFKSTMRLLFDDLLPKWNYTALVPV